MDCAQCHVVCVGKCALARWDELTRVEEQLIEFPQVREELSVDSVELLCEGPAEVSDILMYCPFMAVLR